MLDRDEIVETVMEPDELEEILDASAETVCRDTIGHEYIQKSYTNADLAMILLDITDAESPRISAFIFAHDFTDIHGDRAISLDVICAIQFGGRLLEKCIQYCQTKGYRYIELSALYNVIGFYKRYGFKHQGHCNPMYPPDMDVKPEMAERLRRVKDPYDDPIVMNYLYSLHRIGYTPLIASYDCYDTSISSAKFRQLGCFEDGMEMRRCLVEDTAEPQRNKAADKRESARRYIDSKIEEGQQIMGSLNVNNSIKSKMHGTLDRLGHIRRQLN